MMKKLITCLMFSLFSFLPQVSNAELTGYMTDEEVIGVNCHITICLSKLNIKKKTFGSSNYLCNGYTSEGDCIQNITGKQVVSTDAMAVLTHMINRWIFLSSKNKTIKTVSYGNCRIDANNSDNASCDVWVARWTTAPNSSTLGWQVQYSGRTSSYIVRYPVNCPSSGKYVPGRGCLVDSWYEDGVLIKTKRPPIIGVSPCDACPTSEQKPAKEAQQPFVGNPVDINSGAKVDSHSDIVYPIAFNRNYSSMREGYSKLGGGWKHSFDKKMNLFIEQVNDLDITLGVTFQRENNDEIYFSRDNDTLPFTAVLNEHKGYAVTMSGTNYILDTPSGIKEYYNSDGLLMNIINTNGYTYTLIYNSQKQLVTISDSYNRWLSLIYSDYADVITQINASNGDYIQYTYTNGYLSEAKFNNLETLGYGYTNGLLTSKTDQKGNLYASYTYDNLRRTTEVNHYAAPNVIVGKHQYIYSATGVSVILPNNSISTYVVDVKNYLGRTSSASIAGNTKSTTTAYDYNGNVNSYNDGVYSASYTYNQTNNFLTYSNYRGIIKNYNWDFINKRINNYTETTSTSAKTYFFTYDPLGNIIQKQLTVGGLTRVWGYTYSTFGKPLTKTEPTGAVTVFTYYSDTDENIDRRGMLQTIINGAGHVTTINAYNYQGNPISITLPNGINKIMTYDLRGRLLSESQNGVTNNYLYDAVGLMVQASLGNGYVLNMVYDMDHRMTGMNDNRGNSLVYTFDASGNITNESEYTNSTLVTVKNKLFDNASRLTQIAGNDNTYPYIYTYDKTDRVINVKNPNNENQTYSYNSHNDILNQNGLGRSQSLTRDYDGNITNIYQQGNNTSFTYNALGEMLTMFSFDTGNHSYTHSISTKTKTHTDNANTLETLVYDNLSRPVSITRGIQTETYLWDTVKLGKLTSISDSSGSTNYNYDSNARLSSKTHLVGNISKMVSYSYDNMGQMNKITYPSGMEVNYGYLNGAVSSVQVGTTNLLNNIGYKGFSSKPISWTWGNNYNRNLSINADNRLTGLSDGSILNQAISQDNLGNVTNVTDSLNSNNTFSATYAISEQLTSFNHGLGNKSFVQDSKFNLNRIAPFDTSTSVLHIVSGQSSNHNKVTSLIYGSTYKYPTHDIKGNMTADGKGGVFTYDLANNMITANRGSPASYTYNALHQRVSKTVTIGGIPTTTYFVYNESGLLLGEYDGVGNTITEHVYLGDIPVGVVKGSNTYFVHTDYLNTPRAVSNSNGTVVWKWDNVNAYGYNPANETVSGTPFEYNQRFSGQYFDKETGLHYNYHRMYNPELGRYMQPDPIGVNGGMNTYSYVENNPLNMNDPMGLEIRDKNGNIELTYTGVIEKSNWQVNARGMTISAEYDAVTFKTDKGTIINASKIRGQLPNNWSPNADCHGWTVGDGQIWINNVEMKKVLKDDFTQLLPGTLLQEGDRVIYRDWSNIQIGNNTYRAYDVVHSVQLFNTSQGLVPYGKGGIEYQPRFNSLEGHWEKTDTLSITYYRRNKK